MISLHCPMRLGEFLYFIGTSVQLKQVFGVQLLFEQIQTGKYNGILKTIRIPSIFS